MSPWAVHLGYSISSGDRSDIVKSAKGVVGLALIYSMLILVISPLELKMYYFKNIVVVFLWCTLVVFRRDYGSVSMC